MLLEGVGYSYCVGVTFWTHCVNTGTRYEYIDIYVLDEFQIGYFYILIEN